MRAGLRNGAYFVKPRPFFFTHVVGIRAYMLGRSIAMKAVGMWHWEVRPTPDAYSPVPWVPPCTAVLLIWLSLLFASKRVPSCHTPYARSLTQDIMHLIKLRNRSNPKDFELRILRI